MTTEEMPVKLDKIAEELGFHPRTIRRWVAKGMPAHKKTGRGYLFYRSEVNAWIREESDEGPDAHSG